MTYAVMALFVTIIAAVAGAMYQKMRATEDETIMYAGVLNAMADDETLTEAQIQSMLGGMLTAIQ